MRRNMILEEDLGPQFRKVLYPLHDPHGVLFTDEEECDKALRSGEWVKSPADCQIEEVDEEDEEYVWEYPEDDDINWAERLKLRRPELPPPKKYNHQKYLSQMSVKNLIKEGKKWGLDFSNYYDLPYGDRPTKLNMRHKIKLAMKEIAGIPLR